MQLKKKFVCEKEIAECTQFRRDKSSSEVSNGKRNSTLEVVRYIKNYIKFKEKAGEILWCT